MKFRLFLVTGLSFTPASNQLSSPPSTLSLLLPDDAQVMSQYAKKKAINADDVRLAIQLQVEKSQSNPPPRELLLDIARNKNSQPLPLIKSNAGARLPPDRYSLISCNYKLKPSSQLARPQQVQPSQFHFLNQMNK